MHRFRDLYRVVLHFFLRFLVNSVLKGVQRALRVALAQNRLLLIIFIHNNTWHNYWVIVLFWSIKLLVALLITWTIVVIPGAHMLILVYLGSMKRLNWWQLFLFCILVWLERIVNLRLCSRLIDKFLITDYTFDAVMAHIWKHIPFWLLFMQQTLLTARLVESWLLFNVRVVWGNRWNHTHAWLILLFCIKSTFYFVARFERVLVVDIKARFSRHLLIKFILFFKFLLKC